MFERRLKIFLALMVAVTCVLVMRAAHVQVIQKEQWAAKAAEAAKRSQAIETTRGRILDYKNRVIALDQPCIDACVDFRAMSGGADDPPSKAAHDKWVRQVAVERLNARLRDAYTGAQRSKKAELIKAEVERVRADINAMWGRLARVATLDRDPNATPRQIEQAREQIEQTRNEIVNKVKLRRRYVWYRNYQIAVKRFEEREPAPAWRRWLVDESADPPQEDQFTNLVVAEELADHPVLKAVTVGVQNELRKHIEQYPGLILQPGVQRHYPYPYGEAGCHLIGQLARVDREDLKADPNVGSDELRRYYPNDLIGRSGLERLAEPLLRRSRGGIETVDGRGEVGRVEAVPGHDVRTTIDMDLQYDILAMFQNAKVVNEKAKTLDTVDMHGAAVVIDVQSGEVRAMASNPTFDLNDFQESYARLAADDLNFPMLNRATQVARVPGSTVKPVVGLAGIAERVVGVHQGIECTGYLVINGRRIPNGRCWTQSMFGLGARHQIPSPDPHVGTHGNPTGFLTFNDAVQRSCNVYFETIGDRLKMEGLSEWFDRFGLGRRVGLGIPEVSGSLPDSYRGPSYERKFATWISAIGQGTTTATPVQMANVAATIARGGTWVRPRLLVDGQGVLVPLPEDAGPDRVDLGLPREAVREAQDGMRRVVNTYAGSAYNVVRRPDLLIAGKTGTAQEGSRLKVAVRDANGNVVPDTKNPDPAKRDKPLMRELEPSAPDKLNPEAPWYRGFGPEGKELKHSWFIGFAPADKPKVAFAVMLEYGGSGGAGAGRIAKEIVAALIERKYLDRDTAAAEAKRASDVQRGELLQPHVGD